MSTLKEMAFEYKQAAAKLAMAIERHKVAGDLSEAELKSLRQALRETREAAHLLSGYYHRGRSAQKHYGWPWLDGRTDPERELCVAWMHRVGDLRTRQQRPRP